MKRTPYRSLGITLSVSFVIMYLVMFLNVDDTGHIYLSLTRLYMAVLMVCPMAVLMILMMPAMYKQKKQNAVIVSFSLVLFTVTLWLLRSQVFISDKQYLRAMIPHHSSALLTSKHAKLKDSSVRQLADSIIRSQEREIAEMKATLKKP